MVNRLHRLQDLKEKWFEVLRRGWRRRVWCWCALLGGCRGSLSTSTHQRLVDSSFSMCELHNFQCGARMSTTYHGLRCLLAWLKASDSSIRAPCGGPGPKLQKKGVQGWGWRLSSLLTGWAGACWIWHRGRKCVFAWLMHTCGAGRGRGILTRDAAGGVLV